MTTLPFQTDSEIAAAIPAAVNDLRQGGVLAYPTETVYGFGGAATSDVSAAIAALKGRPAEQQLLVLINGSDMLEGLGLSLAGAARQLAQQYWPGPLTLVLPPDAKAVRWTPHVGMSRLIGQFGAPITSTSVNRTGLAPVRSADEIEREWSVEVASGQLLVLDGGCLPERRPSTLVDCTAPVPRVLREGAVPVAQLRMTLPEGLSVG